MARATPTRIDICVCTFRRPQLAATLRSLAGLEVPKDTEVRILVADNDTGPSAQTLVEEQSEAGLPVYYVHAPEQNISVARNACLDHATGDFIAWIDDDETADPKWLIRAWDTLRHGDHDAVFGPSVAVYPKETPAHIVRGDFHSNRPVSRHGEVRTGHTCNALVDMRRPETRALRFDLTKGRSGGEDTDYFHRLWVSGGNLGISEAAVVYEEVTPGRLRLGWLIRRSFNSGHIFGELSRRGAAATTVIGIALAAVLKAAYCFAVALLNSASAMKRLWWARRGVMHLGVIAGLASIKARAQY